jgi:hypothetical protein
LDHKICDLIGAVSTMGTAGTRYRATTDLRSSVTVADAGWLVFQKVVQLETITGLRGWSGWTG